MVGCDICYRSVRKFTLTQWLLTGMGDGSYDYDYTLFCDRPTRQSIHLAGEVVHASYVCHSRIT